MSFKIPTIRIDADYERDRALIKYFLLNFKSDASLMQGLGEDYALENYKYLDTVSKIASRSCDKVVIDLNDLHAFASTSGTDEFQPSEYLTLLNHIIHNTKRYEKLFCECIDIITPESSRELSVEDEPLEVIFQQRLYSLRQERREDPTEVNQNIASLKDMPFPPELLRRYTLYFKPLISSDFGDLKSLSVRQIKANHLGKLITVTGIVTRTSDVKPYMEVATFTCDRCGCESFQSLNGARFYTPIQKCPSQKCVKDDAKGSLYPSMRASKFVAFQEARIQELTNQVPIGHIPRSIVVHFYGPICRSVSPGDLVDCSGIFLPTPYTGFKAMRAGLLTDTYLEAHHIYGHKKEYENTQMDADTLKAVNEIQAAGDYYERLSRSIAPEIYGHEDVKKALLLLLVGGVTKEMGDGMKIRGDINVCLMGDPGVAKSQLLKFISKVAPRSVYTTGRGSSGAGLTAAVVKDPVTDEMILEGGSLVLADNGVCCIDEFDKMDDSDRTAIHEVIEQQTISISKAGINTSLNSRTSILAAANPLYGRYNPKVSPIVNINLPAALLSRFDILFLILDKPSKEGDEQLARHVAYVHMNSKHPDIGFEYLEPNMIRHYISQARTYRPVLSEDVSNYCVGAYVRLRKEQKASEESDKQFTHTTPRSLLGVIRMSQALARLRFSNEVEIRDVEEALRLMEVSKSSLYETDEKNADSDNTSDSKIYRIIRNLATLDGSSTSKSLQMNSLRERILARGFTENQLQQCLNEYENLGIWQMTKNNTRLVFIDGDGDGDDTMDSD